MSKQGAAGVDRKARVEAMQAQQRRQDQRRTLVWVAATASVIVLLVGGVAWAIIGSRKPMVTLTETASYPNLSRDHVTGKVVYAQTPPAGGNHSAVWQNCGIYTQPVVNENAVHSLEHGAIWVTYRPDVPAESVKILQSDLTGQRYGLLSPYPGLPTPVVATVWGVQLKLQSAFDPRLKAFIATYADASKAPEPKGECTGGTGTPRH